MENKENKKISLLKAIEKTNIEFSGGKDNLLKIDSVSEILKNKLPTYSDNTIKILQSLEGIGRKEKEQLKDSYENLVQEIVSTSSQEDFLNKRIGKYRNYRSIFRMIEYTQKAHHVISSAILSPDDIEKTSLNLSVTNKDSELLKKCREILNNIHLDGDGLELIVDRCVSLGDFYVEIADMNQELKSFFMTEDVTLSNETKSTVTLSGLKEELKKETSNKPILEAEEIIDKKPEQIKNQIDILLKKELMETIDKDFSVNFNLTVPDDIEDRIKTRKAILRHGKCGYQEYMLEDFNKNQKVKINDKEMLLEDLILKEGSNKNPEDYYLKYHEPYNVIPVKKGNVVFGYIVFNNDNNPLDSTNVSNGYSPTSPPVNTNMFGGAGLNPGMQNFGGNNLPYNSGAGLGRMFGNNGNNYGSKITKFIEEIHKMLKNRLGNILLTPELKKGIIDMLRLSTKDCNGQNNIDAYFVTPDRMEKFKIMDDQDDPFFGASILANSEYKAKLMIIMATTIAINRLSGATDILKMGIETKQTRKTRNAISRLKEQYLRVKQSVDGFDSISSIPSQVATTQILTVPKKDGTEIVDFERLSANQAGGDTVDDYKSIRDEYVAGLYVPPAFLGIEENVESKATLTQENAMFANNVLAWQKKLTKGLTSLLCKMYYLIHNENVKSLVNLTLNPPKSLQLDLQIEYMGKLADLRDKLKELDEFFDVDRYLSGWLPQDADGSKTLEDLRSKLESEIEKAKSGEDDEAGGMGGGF